MFKLEIKNEKTKRILAKTNELMIKAAPIAMCVGVMALSLIDSFAFAGAGDAKGLADNIQEIISTLILILGALIAIMGIIHFASAYSEGDGPAKQKAIMQMAAGIMLAVLSMVLGGDAFKLSDYVN